MKKRRQTEREKRIKYLQTMLRCSTGEDRQEYLDELNSLLEKMNG